MNDAVLNALGPFGAAALLMWFMAKRDAAREERMSAALAAQQVWVQEKLLAALDRGTAATERATAAMEQMAANTAAMMAIVRECGRRGPG